jgi:hypothetical protein
VCGGERVRGGARARREVGFLEAHRDLDVGEVDLWCGSSPLRRRGWWGGATTASALLGFGVGLRLGGFTPCYR